jgi:Tol biopolymer transport system component
VRRVTIGLIAALMLLVPADARAAFGPGASLVSANPATHEQVDENVQTPAISGDGRYVVFQTNARNLFPADDPDPPGFMRQGGLFRRDLATGALDVVAYGNLMDATGIAARGAQNPSISEDGRYVAFSSGWKLAPADTNPNVDIYVRDMTKPITDPDAYRLASAKDGGTIAPAYASPAVFQGSELTPGVSLSADGTKVLFRTRIASDLPNEATTSTPTAQLFVRDLSNNTTTLVTRRMADSAPVIPDGGVDTNVRAALSADGTTVVWTAQYASQQTRFLPGEIPDDVQQRYYLWRRVADGPSAPTRRISGPVDLDDPGCTDAVANGYVPDPSAVGPCYGPLAYPEDTQGQGFASGKVPAVSADGRFVAFLTGIVPRGTQIAVDQRTDLWITDMGSGVSRKAGTVRLTARSTSTYDSATNGNISSISMSADGRRIAFVTQRTTFLLPDFQLITPPLPQPDIVQLYVLDRDRAELELASRGIDAGGANQAIDDLPSMSASGKQIAFTSGATNLFYGDANERADAFLVSDGGDSTATAAAGEPPFSGYSSAPEPGRAGPVRLKLSSRHRGNRVELRVRVPGAGTLSATARAHGATVARRSAHLRAAGTAELVLRPRDRFRKLLRRRGRLAATVTVRFTPASSGATLTKKQRVTFKR